MPKQENILPYTHSKNTLLPLFLKSRILISPLYKILFAHRDQLPLLFSYIIRPTEYIIVYTKEHLRKSSLSGPEFLINTPDARPNEEYSGVKTIGIKTWERRRRRLQLADDSLLLLLVHLLLQVTYEIKNALF